MKQTSHKVLVVTFLITLFIVNDGCQPNNEVVKSNCRLTQIVSTSSYTTGASDSFNATLDYDDKGQLISSAYISEKKDNSSQIKSADSYVLHYQYDAEGYLIKCSTETVYIEPDKDAYKTDFEYQYQNGRLVKISGKLIEQSVLYTHVYDYDANGKLSKYTTTVAWGSYSASNIYDFKTNKVTMTGLTGAQTEGELDAEGYLIREVDLAGIERRYQYDNEGNLIRKEEWMNDKMYSADVYEYDNRTAIYIPGPTTLRGFKGIPDLNIDRITSPIHNRITAIHFDVDISGNEVISSSTAGNLQYNTSGYPITATGSESDGAGSIVSTSNTTFTYKDCQ